MSEATTHASVSGIPQTFEEMIRVYGSSVIKAKIRTMKIWSQDVQDVFQEVLMVLLRRDIINRYHRSYADRAFHGDPASVEAKIVQLLEEHDVCTTEFLAEQIGLSVEDVQAGLKRLGPTAIHGTATFTQFMLPLNEKEQLLFDCFAAEPIWTISALTEECFASAQTKDRTSWTRNSMRRLVREGAVQQIARGTYERVDPTGWQWRPLAGNALRFKRYLTNSVRNIVLDYMKRVNRDAMSYRLLYVPETSPDGSAVQGIDTIDRIWSHLWENDYCEEALEMASLSKAASRLEDDDQQLLSEMMEPVFVAVPKEASTLPEGRNVRVRYGDDLVMGTIVLRRVESGQSGEGVERHVMLRPSRDQRLRRLGLRPDEAAASRERIRSLLP
jgi:hypothetical protein